MVAVEVLEVVAEVEVLEVVAEVGVLEVAVGVSLADCVEVGDDCV